MGLFDKLTKLAGDVLNSEVGNSIKKAFNDNLSPESAEKIQQALNDNIPVGAKNTLKNVFGDDSTNTANSSNSSVNISGITRLPTEKIDRTISTGKAIERTGEFLYYSNNSKDLYEVSFMISKDFVLNDFSNTGVEIGLVYGPDKEDYGYDYKIDSSYLYNNPIINFGGDSYHFEILCGKPYHQNCTICDIEDEYYAAKTTYTTSDTINMTYFWRVAPDEEKLDWVVLELTYPLKYINTEFEKEILTSYLEAIATFKAKRIK